MLISLCLPLSDCTLEGILHSWRKRQKSELEFKLILLLLGELLGLWGCSKPFWFGTRISKSALDSFWPFCINVNSEFLKFFCTQSSRKLTNFIGDAYVFFWGGGRANNSYLTVQEEAGHLWSSLRGKRSTWCWPASCWCPKTASAPRGCWDWSW